MAREKTSDAEAQVRLKRAVANLETPPGIGRLHQILELEKQIPGSDFTKLTSNESEGASQGPQRIQKAVLNRRSKRKPKNQ